MNSITVQLPCLAARTPLPLEQQTQWLAEQLSLPVTDVQNAVLTIAIGGLCAICCSLVGCFLVLRRMSLLGDALSHSVLAGTAGVYLLTGSVEPFPMLSGALVAGVATAVLTQFVHKSGDVPEDSSIGIVFTSLFAFGVVVVSRAQNVHLDLDCVLFGSLENALLHMDVAFGVLWPESFRTLLPALVITLAFLAAFWKELRLTSFDPTLAITMGFSATMMHYLLTTVVAIVTVSALEVVGLLVIALLVVPPATARLLTNRLPTMMWLSCLLGVLGTVCGYAAALRYNSSAAGLTAVFCGIFLLLTVLLSPKNGMLGRFLRGARLRVRICAEDVLAGLFRLQERLSDPHDRAVVSTSECRAMAGGGLLAIPAIRWLHHRQLLQTEGAGVSLTKVGMKHAKSLVRSHRLWELYLSENFDLSADHLHDPAEAMEHFIGPELQKQIGAELAAPDEDPHGRIIPDEN